MIDQGLLARHARRVLREYRTRRDARVQATERRLGRFSSLFTSRSGLHGAFLFDDRRIAVDRLVRRAERRGIALLAEAVEQPR